MTQPIDWETVTAQQTFMLLGERNQHLKLANAIINGDHEAALALAQREVMLNARLSNVERHMKDSCGACGRLSREDAETVAALRDQLGIMAERLHAGKNELAEERAGDEGRDARRRGVPFEQCPYHPQGAPHTDGVDVAKGAAWRNGWLEQDRVEHLLIVARCVRQFLFPPDAVQADRWTELVNAYRALVAHDGWYGGEFAGDKQAED